MFYFFLDASLKILPWLSHSYGKSKNEQIDPGFQLRKGSAPNSETMVKQRHQVSLLNYLKFLLQCSLFSGAPYRIITRLLQPSASSIINMSQSLIVSALLEALWKTECLSRRLAVIPNRMKWKSCQAIHVLLFLNGALDLCAHAYFHVRINKYLCSNFCCLLDYAMIHYSFKYIFLNH